MSHPKNVGRLLAASILLTLASLAPLWTPARAAAPPGGGQMAAESQTTVEIIVGELERGPRGLLLRAQDGDFRLKGPDMSKDLGRQVEVTGVISEEDHPLPLIKVQSYKVLR
jgi:hypothetical protein